MGHNRAGDRVKARERRRRRAERRVAKKAAVGGKAKAVAKA